MSEVGRIVDQLKRSVDGGAWHGPALFELLNGVSADTAIKRPLVEAHTIWEIALHCAVWMEQIRMRVLGKGEKDLPPERDWPSPPSRTDDRSWVELLERLRSAHVALAAEISRFDEALLDNPLMKGARRLTFRSTA